MRTTLTKEMIISNTITAGARYTNMHTLTGEMYYHDFAQIAGLPDDISYHIQKYISGMSYADKFKMFQDLGFEALYVTLDFMKACHFVRTNKHPVTNKTLEEEMLDGNRNVFIFEISDYTTSIYFVLDYTDKENPLTNHCDWAEIKRQKEQREKLKSIFNFGSKS